MIRNIIYFLHLWALATVNPVTPHSAVDLLAVDPLAVDAHAPTPAMATEAMEAFTEFRKLCRQPIPTTGRESTEPRKPQSSIGTIDDDDLYGKPVFA